jgi:pimeloyl-ACP methyl ester carboxylesterase
MKISKYTVSLILLLLMCSCRNAGLMSEMRNPDDEYVVLLHGMGRTHRSMTRMQKMLTDEGYAVVNLPYDSSSGTIEKIVKRLEREIPAKCIISSKRINFVTHSLGGILVRAYLAKDPDIQIGRVVMLAPPNKGSELTDTFKGIKLYEQLNGPAGLELGTGSNSLVVTLGPADFEVGVIAGDRSMNPLYSSIVKGLDDGKVSVENAKLEGMKDFLVVHSTHTFIMQRKFVIAQVIRFLKYGQFDHRQSE